MLLSASISACAKSSSTPATLVKTSEDSASPKACTSCASEARSCNSSTIVVSNSSTVFKLAIDELLDIQKLDKEVASAIIMTARENEGWFK
jgi:N utilization substance protein A